MAASHLAVWPGLYIVGAAAFLAQVSGIDAMILPRDRLTAAAFAFCTAAAVYLLDRVKLRDAWLDPADADAHPHRFNFIARRSAALRALVVALLIAAAALGAALTPWGALIPVLAAAGVLVYAARPRSSRPRPKDVLLVKNAYVAGGITGFSTLVALAAVAAHSNSPGIGATVASHAAPLMLACAHLALRVIADAVLCDLDDESADRRYGTSTLPTNLGRDRAWNFAMAARLCSAVLLMLIPALPLLPRLSWAIITIISSIALRVAAPGRVRDWVDARLPCEAAIVACCLVFARR